MANKPFNTSGINLARTIPAGASGTISDLDIGIYTDSEGNLTFKDDFVVNDLGKPFITLRELYTRSKGVYLGADGGLWFNDESLSRPYSLNEIVNSCRRWKENLASGSLWWIGGTQFTHAACANLPRQNDQTGPNKVWSIDRFLSEVNQLATCSSPDVMALYNNLTDGEGRYKWFDVPGIEIVIPPVEDSYKVSMILAKLAYSSYNQPEPVLFRLFDWTTQTELTRTSVINGCSDKVMNPVSLSYFGRMPNTANSANCLAEENCGCVEVVCIDGDDTCAAPDTGTIITNRFAEGSRLIKVQFQVINYQTNHWERVFGAEIDDEYLAQSTLDAIIFDVNPNAKFAKKQGTVQLRNTDTYIVTFEQALQSTDYTIALSSGTNVNIWYANKSTTGFTIKAELPFTGFVDWSIVNINSDAG